MIIHRDDDLNLEQLFARCKQMAPGMAIRVYFDTDTYLFYITFMDTMDFFLPVDSVFVCECRAEGVRLSIEIYIAQLIRKIQTTSQS